MEVSLFNSISLTALFDIGVFMYHVHGWMDVKDLNVSKGIHLILEFAHIFSLESCTLSCFISTYVPTVMLLKKIK